MIGKMFRRWAYRFIASLGYELTVYRNPNKLIGAWVGKPFSKEYYEIDNEYHHITLAFKAILLTLHLKLGEKFPKISPKDSIKK